MQNLRNQLIAGGAVLLLAAIGTMMNRPAVQAAGGPSVTIESPIPLPVTGTVAVTGSTTVSGSVHVNNTVTDPVRVRNVNDAIQAFQATGGCNGPASCTTTIFTVPTGKRAVIEYFSGAANILGPQDGRPFTVFLRIQMGGGPPIHHFVPMSPVFSSGTQSGITGWGQQVRLYADSGTAIEGTGSDGSFDVVASEFTISGYLVDVPFAP